MRNLSDNSIPSIGFEARLVGFSKKADKNGTWTAITLHIHPQDVPEELATADLRSVWMVGMAAVGDDGHPEPVQKPKRKWEDLPRSARAGILCQDERFQKWVSTLGRFPATEMGAKQFIYQTCTVRTRADLDLREIAGCFDSIVSQFRSDTGQIAEVRDGENEAR